MKPFPISLKIDDKIKWPLIFALFTKNGTFMTVELFTYLRNYNHFTCLTLLVVHLYVSYPCYFPNAIVSHYYSKENTLAGKTYKEISNIKDPRMYFRDRSYQNFNSKRISEKEKTKRVVTRECLIYSQPAYPKEIIKYRDSLFHL